MEESLAGLEILLAVALGDVVLNLREVLPERLQPKDVFVLYERRWIFLELEDLLE